MQTNINNIMTVIPAKTEETIFIFNDKDGIESGVLNISFIDNNVFGAKVHLDSESGVEEYELSSPKELQGAEFKFDFESLDIPSVLVSMNDDRYVIEFC